MAPPRKPFLSLGKHVQDQVDRQNAAIAEQFRLRCHPPKPAPFPALPEPLPDFESLRQQEGGLAEFGRRQEEAENEFSRQFALHSASMKKFLEAEVNGFVLLTLIASRGPCLAVTHGEEGGTLLNVQTLARNLHLGISMEENRWLAEVAQTMRFTHDAVRDAATAYKKAEWVLTWLDDLIEHAIVEMLKNFEHLSK